MTYQEASNTITKWWPVLVVIVVGIAATSIANYRITVNAEELKQQELDLGSLENRVIVEGTATQLALQALKINQELAIEAQKTTAIRQNDKLDAILRNLTVND